MADSLPEAPIQLKNIQSFMKVALDIQAINPVVSYWLRLYSIELALKTDKNSPESKSFLSSLIIWLEKFKQSHKDNEAVSNETVGQAHMENFVVSLFTKADTLDRSGVANKTTVRMFYMAAVLFEAMAVFGDLSEEVSKKAKYAKFKAAYIQKCLKLGQTPKPGPIESADLDGNPDLPSEDPNPTNSNDRVDVETPQNPINPAPPTFATEPVAPFVMPVPINETSTVKPATTIDATKFYASNGTPLSPEDLIKSQKYCKFASSALQYDDIPTAVSNLEKALKLLTTGKRVD